MNQQIPLDGGYSGVDEITSNLPGLIQSIDDGIKAVAKHDRDQLENLLNKMIAGASEAVVNWWNEKSNDYRKDAEDRIKQMENLWRSVKETTIAKDVTPLADDGHSIHQVGEDWSKLGKDLEQLQQKMSTVGAVSGWSGPGAAQYATAAAPLPTAVAELGKATSVLASAYVQAGFVQGQVSTLIVGKLATLKNAIEAAKGLDGGAMTYCVGTSAVIGALHQCQGDIQVTKNSSDWRNPTSTMAGNISAADAQTLSQGFPTITGGTRNITPSSVTPGNMGGGLPVIQTSDACYGGPGAVHVNG